MAKKRTGLDALREYEARSGRQTQSGNQQTGNAGSSGGTWRSGLDALREYEASGGGQNVKNGPYNPDYRTNTKKATPQSYEAAYQQYKQIANSINHDQMSGYLRTMQERQNQIIDSINHDQMSGYRRTLQEKDRQQQRKVQTGTAAKQAATNAGQDYSRLIGLNQFDGELERRDAEQEKRYRETVLPDKLRGMKRTSEELQKQIDQLYEQKSDEHFRDYQFGEDGTAWYTDENGTRRQARGVTDIQSEIEALETRKAALDSGRALGQAENTVGTMDTATRNLLKDINGTNLLKKTDAKHQLQQKGYSEDQIGRLAEYEKYLEDFEDYQTRMAGAQQFGRDAPVFSTVTSSLMAPFKALGNIESFRGILPKGLGGYQNPDMPTNIYSPMYAATHVSSGIRSGVMDGMGSVGQFLYQAGTSALDSAVNMAVSTAIVGTTGLSGEEASSAVAETMNWVMGSQVAADSVYAGIQSGKSNQEALIDGIVDGAIEGFTEKYSVGDIIETMLSGKQVWKKAMRAFASEGAEEIASNWLNRIYDVVAKHDRGEVMGAYAEYLSKGNTKEKALALTLADMLTEDGLSFLAGGISGLAMSGAYAGTNKAVEARSRGQQLNVIGQVMDAVESMAKERGDQATAEAAQAVMDKVKAGQMPETAEVQAVVDSAVKADQAAQAEAAFQTYNQYADERDAKTRDAEKASWARSQENTEAINDAEADSAADAFEKLNEAEVKGAADARARQQTEEARAERTFAQESRDDADRLLTEAARRYGFDDRMTSVLLSGYDGEQDAQQYAENVNAAYEYGRNGMSLSAAQRAAQGVNADVAQEAWNAGRASIQRAPMSAFERYNQYAEERDARQAAREAPQQASVQTVQAVQEAARPQQAPTQTAVQEAREAAQTAQETEPKAQERVRETAQEQAKPAQERAETKPAKQKAQESKPQALAANQYAAREMAESVIKKYKMTVPDAVKDYSKRLDEAVAERYRLAEADGKSEESKATVSSMIASFQIGLRGIGFVSNKTNNADFLADAQAWLIGNAVAKGSYARIDAAKAFDGLGIEERTLRYAGEVYHFGDSLTQRMIREYNAQKGKNKGVSAAEYAKRVLNVFDRGALGESLAGTKDRLLGDGMTRAAWNAGKGFINGEEAGSTAADEVGKRDAGMDSGEQAGAVAEGTGGAKTRSAKASAVAERIELENRVRAAGQPYLSGKDIGLEKGSAQRSFREAPESTWTDSMKAAAAMLQREGFKEVHFTVGAISVENQRAKVTRYADGVAMGDAVWINATSKKWSVEQLANHEAFHHQIQDWPYAMDAVRQALADELGEDGIQELAQRYAEAYEGCYDGAELDAYIEEICADAYAGMDRLPEAKTQIIQKAAQRAKDAQQATEENGGTRAPPEKYSVNEGFSKDVAEWYRDGMPEGEAFVLGSTGETLQGLGAIESDIYMNGDKINTILREHPEMTIREIQKIPELLDDPILILKSKGSGKGGNSRLVLFGSINTQDGQPVLAVLDLRPRENGFVLDDMQKVNSAYAKANPASFISQSDVLFADKKRTVPLLRRFGLTITSRELLRDGSIGSISYRGNSVNISGEKFSSIVQMGDRPMDAKFSADDTTATPQENDKTALAYFGRTYKWSETGYVLLNGARLDFSGRHEGGSGGYRSVDHRDIIDALGEDYGGGDYTGGMVRFMQEGNIRISPESGGINLAVMPTKAQMDALSDFISKERGEVILDIDDASGNTISSTEYPRGTHANKVLQDIRNYFNDGTLPEVSASPSVSQFRYSVAEDAQEGGGTTAFTLDSIPKKAQDYLRRVRGQTAAAIQQTLSMPFAARQEVLKPAIEEMMNEYLQTGRISQETVDRSFEESYRRGVEMDTEFYDQYKDVKTRLRDLKVTLSEADRADIADFNDFRRAASGRLRIANEGGLTVDVAYKEMQQMAPELFPESITHPADQLMRMFEVSKQIEKVQRSLDEYHGEDAEEFKRWAKNDYEASVENMLGALNVARRYAEARMRQQQARAVPTTMEEVKSLYADLKGLRRTYERAAAKNLLTAEDNSVLNRLLRGEITPEDVQGMENAQGILAMYEAKADYDAAAAKIADWRRYQKGKLREQADNLLKNAEKAKDKTAGIEYSRETMTRNVRDIFPEADAEAINKTYFEPVRTASANANKLKNKLREQVKALDLSRKARKGDAVSEAHAVQLLGEAQDNIRYLEQHPRAKDRDGKTLNEWRQIVLDLWATSPGLDRAKIENAVETFRKIYDGLFEQMNDVRIRNGYEPINYRQGYFPHFQPGTTDGILGLMGKALGIDAEVTALPTTISGLTHTFKPGITYFGNALERIGFDTAYDAVEGFDKYVEGAASVICYTDAIQKLRALAQQVRYRTSDEGLRERVDDIRARDDLTEHQKELEIKEIMDKGQFSLSNFAVELDEYTNLLANKKSKYDRSMEHLGGRKLYNFMRAWQNRVAANMVAVNPASWLTNFGVITQAGAQLKTISVLKGMWQTLANIKTSDGLVEASDFLTNRAGSDPLVRTWQQSASAFLSTPMEWIDQFSAGTIVRARYMENIERGMSEETAMREADDFAANVMADRSKGAMPTLFEARNPLMKMFTQFQLEVNNTYSYLFKDLPREQRKKGVRYLALALFKFLIGGFLYNELYEYLIGRRPMLDPLGIVNDTVGDLTGYELNNLVDAAAGGGLIKESEPESAVGTIRNLAENVGQEAPFIGNLMGGGKLPFSSSMPNVKNILTALDSETATDEEKLAKIGKEMVNPAAYWLLPFGGGQIKKMWQGISALKRQGSYTADGRLQYPIYTDREGDKANAAWRTLLFGKSATPEAQAWVEAGFGALSEKATQTYEAMRAGGVDQRDSYELIKAMSKVKKTDTQTKEQLQMQLLNAFDIEDSGKVLYYYNMMASDKERAQIDKLLAEGADMGEYLRYLQEKSGVTGEKDADGKTISGSVKEETFALIDGLNLTPEQKTELAKEDYTTTGFEPWSGYREALKAGGDTWDAFYQNAVSAKVADGKTQEDAEKAVKSDLKSQLKEDYLGGSMPESEVSDYLQKYCGAEDEHDVYWTLEEWKGGEGWKKYGQFLDAVDKGVLADTRKVAKEYMKHGVDKGDLSSQLTKHFKEAWLAATGDEATRLKNAYISAYKAIGGDADKARDNIIKWRREANKRKGDKK